MKTYLLLTLAVLMSSHSFAETTASGGSNGTSGGSSGDTYKPTEAQLKCMIDAAGEGSNNSVKDADEKAKALQKVLDKMNWSSSDFNDTSLAHFLAQCTAESAMGNNNKEGGSGTGTGWIQVSNDAKGPADSCAKEKGLGGINQASGQNQEAACAVSMCWWEASIIKNGHNKPISKDDSKEADKHVSEMVNQGHDAGGTGKGMTGGSANAEKRAAAFEKISEAVKTKCRSI